MARHLPPLPWIVAFVAVTRRRSVTRAAADLCLTQSAVSHQIAQFETYFGERLFVRAERTVHPTPVAVDLAARLEVLLTELDGALQDARSRSRRRDLCVVVPPELFAQWLGSRLDVFAAGHPDIDIRLVQDYRRASFTEDDADIQIRLGVPGPAQGGFVLLADEEFSVCSPELAGVLPQREAFEAAPFLRYRGASHTSLDWSRWLGELLPGVTGPDCEIARRIESGPVFATFQQMMEACRRGEGFALVRGLLVADDLATGRLVAPLVERLTADLSYCVVHSQGTQLRKPAEIFLAWIRDEADRSRRALDRCEP